MKRLVQILCLAGLLPLVACGGGSVPVTSNPPPSNPNLPPLPTPAVPIRVETYVAGAAFPVALVFAPDGRLFYNELQTGNIRIVLANGTLQVQPFATVVPLSTSGEQGLLGLALDPNFATNRFVYVHHTTTNPLRNRVIRFEDANGTGTNLTVIVDNLPATNVHNGGRIGFARDGRLYVTTGDSQDPANSQSSNSTSGKVLSYNAAIPLSGPQIVALGLRNPFGVTFHPVGGTPYVSDNGPNCDDEINRITAGGNYGWRPSYPCGDNDPAFIQPLTRFTPPIAPTGLVFYTGTVFPEWRNHLFLASFNDGNLRRFVPDESQQGRILETQVIINGGFGAMLDVTVGPDGNLYIAAQSAILRVVRGP